MELPNRDPEAYIDYKNDSMNFHGSLFANTSIGCDWLEEMFNDFYQKAISWKINCKREKTNSPEKAPIRFKKGDNTYCYIIPHHPSGVVITEKLFNFAINDEKTSYAKQIIIDCTANYQKIMYSDTEIQNWDWSVRNRKLHLTLESKTPIAPDILIKETLCLEKDVEPFNISLSVQQIGEVNKPIRFIMLSDEVKNYYFEV